MAYTTQTNLENFLKRSLTTQEVDLLTITLSTVDAWINKQLDDIGWGTVSESTKYYDGNRVSILEIDPCYAVTAVTIVDNEEAVSYTYELDQDFELKPRNETAKTYIELRGNRCWPYGVGNIAVTAKFSRGETTPDDITYLATYMASKLYNDAVKKGIKTESIEGYSRAFLGVLQEYTLSDGIVKDILSKYTSQEVRI